MIDRRRAIEAAHAEATIYRLKGRRLNGSTSSGAVDALAANLWNQTGHWTFAALFVSDDNAGVAERTLWSVGDTSANVPLIHAGSISSGEAQYRVWPVAAMETDVRTAEQVIGTQRAHLAMWADVADGGGLGRIFHQVDGGGVNGPDPDAYSRAAWANRGHVTMGAIRRNGPVTSLVFSGWYIWGGAAPVNALGGGGASIISDALRDRGPRALSAAFAQAGGYTPATAPSGAFASMAAEPDPDAFGPSAVWTDAPIQDVPFKWAA